MTDALPSVPPPDDYLCHVCGRWHRLLPDPALIDRCRAFASWWASRWPLRACLAFLHPNRYVDVRLQREAAARKDKQ